MSTDRIPSASVTASGNSGALFLGDGNGLTLLSLIIDVTAVTGTTPTLDLALEWSTDGVTFAASETPDTFTQITSTSLMSKQFNVKGSSYRLVWTVGGTTPDFTFAVDEYVA